MEMTILVDNGFSDSSICSSIDFIVLICLNSGRTTEYGEHKLRAETHLLNDSIGFWLFVMGSEIICISSSNLTKSMDHLLK